MLACFFLCALLYYATASSELSERFLKGTESSDTVVLENGYTKISFSKIFGHVNSLQSDFSGHGKFSDNVLMNHFGLEVLKTTKCLHDIKPLPKVTWLVKTNDLHIVQISDIYDCEFNPLISESWILSLSKNKRSVEITVSGILLRDEANVVSISHSLYLKPKSIYGLFDRGVMQMMNKDDACMGTTDGMNRTYFIGNNHSLDFIPISSSLPRNTVVLLSKHTNFNSGLQNVLYGEYPDLTNNMRVSWNTLCWKNASFITVKKASTYSVAYSLIPNNHDFPVYLLNDVTSTGLSSNKHTEGSLSSNLDIQSYLTGIYASPVGCLQSYYENQTGIIAPTIAHPDIGYSPNSNFFDPDNYMSLSAMMYSNDNYLIQQVKQVLLRTAETMCGIGSDTNTTYCDLDRQRMTNKLMHIEYFNQHAEFLKTQKESFSEQNSRFSEQNSRFSEKKSRITPSILLNTRSGQLMHHFIDLVPTYESIAGSEQLGPNIFWTLSVLKYISITQDTEFAIQMFDYIFLSTKFLLTFYDERKDLLLAPGPLWIDVIIRENYTTDSNVMIVPVLRELSEYFVYVHSLTDVDNTNTKHETQLKMELLSPNLIEFSSILLSLSDRIVHAVNKHLWTGNNGTGTNTDDHYITQLNLDDTTRDFVDYDSNLIAVAYDIASANRTAALIQRVDSGAYTHIRGTWCSEMPYNGNDTDCYIVGGTVCGDSIVTLGRIGWVDSWARKRIGDLRTFDELLLKPLQKDLIRDTWLYERYDANGTQIRTSFYFEYPSLVAIMLREIRYGINLHLNSVEIDPFPAAPFTFALGEVSVSYSTTYVSLLLSGNKNMARSKVVTVKNVLKNQLYDINNSCQLTQNIQATSDDMGTLQFDAIFVTGCQVTAEVAK